MTRTEMIQWLDQHSKIYIPPSSRFERYRYASLIFKPTGDYDLKTNEEIYSVCANNNIGKYVLCKQYQRYQRKLETEFQRKHPDYYIGTYGLFSHWLTLEKEDNLKKPILHNAAWAPDNLTDQELQDRIALVKEIDAIAQKLHDKLLRLLKLQ